MKLMSALHGLGKVLEALVDLDRHSTACATAMMAHNTTDMLSATRAALDCADIAATAHRVLSRDTATDVGVTRAILQAAATAADRCAVECGQHAVHHSHCRIHSETARHTGALPSTTSPDRRLAFFVERRHQRSATTITSGGNRKPAKLDGRADRRER
ncbi:MAG TPA: hypothetical protein VJ757_01635 [Pseudonocardiaceae bacterium]|nr:hypothetical protein [Pseudonocardiaceae bacterium]